MSNDNSTFTGKVLVRCDVLVNVGGTTMGDMHVLKSAAEDTAKKYVGDVMLESLVDPPKWFKDAKVIGATAEGMTIVWPGEKS